MSSWNTPAGRSVTPRPRAARCSGPPPSCGCGAARPPEEAQREEEAMATTTIDVVPVRETAGTGSESYRAIKIVWKRELIRWSRNRTRIVTALMQPILFLFVLGTGLADLLPKSTGHVDFKTFIFPGVLAMIVLFVSIYSAVSIVWDREFGFMREMMVAPVPRAAIVVGKCLGGATVATIQGAILLAMAGLVHVPYNPILIITTLLELTLTAFTLTALGILLAARMHAGGVLPGDHADLRPAAVLPLR